MLINKIANFGPTEANWSSVTTYESAITETHGGVFCSCQVIRGTPTSCCEYKYDYDRILIKNTFHLSKLIVGFLLLSYEEKRVIQCLCSLNDKNYYSNTSYTDAFVSKITQK